MRKPLLAIVTAFAGLGLVAATALPALAVDTVVTFSITTAGITISAPGTVNLGSVAAGATSISGQIGPVTVTDDRATLNGSWTVTAISTDFTPVQAHRPRPSETSMSFILPERPPPRRARGPSLLVPAASSTCRAWRSLVPRSSVTTPPPGIPGSP